MILDLLRRPIVLAPLAGGPSTPELAAAVTEAGGLGFLATGYLDAAAAAARLLAARGLTRGPLGVNLFVPSGEPSDPAHYAGYVRRLTDWAREAEVTLGDPDYSDDDWEAKLRHLRDDPVAVVSFTFGCPPAASVAALQEVGSEVWVTVTSPGEAAEAAASGVDALVVQGAEAGGHRGSFRDAPDAPIVSLLPLLGLVRAVSDLPLVASGGIATPEAVEAVLAAGARAAQVGTAFLRAPEAGTSAPHRAALAGDAPTVLTRAFTGRLARGIQNGFIAAHEAAAPLAYPEIHYVTAPMRRDARAAGRGDLINLWAGEAYRLAREEPAATTVQRLAGRRGADPARGAPAVFDAHADVYDAGRRRLVPPFDALYGTAVEAVALAGEPRRILDLGAGTGILARHLRAAYPSAALTLVDGSARMLDRARETLAGSDIAYVEADLRDPLPAGPWDAIVSALAIHHLDDTDKRDLFARIHAALTPGGVFVNAEQVEGPSPRLTGVYAAWHEQQARAAGSDATEWAAAEQRMALDRCATVEAQLTWLRAAGFRETDCLFKQYRFAVTLAVR